MSSTASRTFVVGIPLILVGLAGSVHAKVTGITFDPKSPVVGHTVTAIATDDQKHQVTQWDWYCRLDDAGSYDPVAMQSVEPGRATLKLLIGGTYTVSLRVTYGGPKPPPEETFTVPLVIARPDAFKVIKGFDSTARYFDGVSVIEIRSQIKSGSSDVGESLLGMAQRRIRNRTWWNRKKEPDGKWPGEAHSPVQPTEAPLTEFNHFGGVILAGAALRIAREDWAKIGSGKPIVTWDEDVRLVYGVGSGEFPTHGGGKFVKIECQLRTMHFAIYKVDDDHWALRENEGDQPKGTHVDQPVR